MPASWALLTSSRMGKVTLHMACIQLELDIQLNSLRQPSCGLNSSRNSMQNYQQALWSMTSGEPCTTRCTGTSSSVQALTPGSCISAQTSASIEPATVWPSKMRRGNVITLKHSVTTVDPRWHWYQTCPGLVWGFCVAETWHCLVGSRASHPSFVQTLVVQKSSLAPLSTSNPNDLLFSWSCCTMRPWPGMRFTDWIACTGSFPSLGVQQTDWLLAHLFLLACHFQLAASQGTTAGLAFHFAQMMPSSCHLFCQLRQFIPWSQVPTLSLYQSMLKAFTWFFGHENKIVTSYISA